jgi:CRISPR-associated endoribonuclease Cas6
MLLSVVIQLEALQNGEIPAWQGRALYAAFLEQWLGKVDAGLASSIHESGKRKPFTCSNLQGERRASRGRLAFKTGDAFWWRLTTLTDKLSDLLLASIPNHLPTEFNLCGSAFRLAGIITDPQVHDWAGESSYERFIEDHLAPSADKSDSLVLEFSSPTSFHAAAQPAEKGEKPVNKIQLFPLPEIVFNAWQESWNLFAPIRFVEKLHPYAEKYIAVSRYDLQTDAAFYFGSPQIGFTGTCAYRFLNSDPLLTRLCTMFARYAFYCGSGYQTTIGFGQTRLSHEMERSSSRIE